MQILQYCYITVLWIHGLIVMMLVEGRGKMAVLLAVTAVLLQQSDVEKWTNSNVVSKL